MQFQENHQHPFVGLTIDDVKNHDSITNVYQYPDPWGESYKKIHIDCDEVIDGVNTRVGYKLMMNGGKVVHVYGATATH